MQQTFHFDELDQVSREYLLAIRRNQGDGAPGVYVPTSNWLPTIGMICGVVLVAVVLIFTLAPLDNPTGMAFLQTALLLTGGWMIVAAVRVWIGANFGTHLGHFVYADASRLWHVQGGRVTVIDLDGLVVAVATDNYNDGNYQNTTVELGLGGGRHVALNVNNLAGAHELVNYLNALAVTRTAGATAGGGAPWQFSAAAKGPLGGYYAPTSGRADPALEHSPAPQRVPRPLAGLIACGVIVLIGALTFYLMRELNVVMRDHAIFDLLKAAEQRRDPDNAEYLRVYLLDPRNTRHVDQVKEMLARHYDGPGGPVQTIRENGHDQELREKFADLVATLKAATWPAVSIRVTEEAGPGLEARGELTDESRAARAERMREKLAEGLCGAVGGEKLIRFVKVDDAKPLIDVTYKFAGTAEGRHEVECTVSVRRRPTEEPFTKTLTARLGGFVASFDHEAIEQAGRVSRAMTGRDHTSQRFLDPRFSHQNLGNPAFIP